MRALACLAVALAMCSRTPTQRPDGGAEDARAGGPVALPPLATVQGGEDAACAAQRSFLRLRESYAVAGDGVVMRCLGEPILETIRSTCKKEAQRTRCRVDGQDLEYDASERLRSIRIHYPPRLGVRAPFGNPLQLADAGVRLGQRVDDLPPDFRQPKTKRDVTDAEFGPLEIWEFDGLELEIGRVDGAKVVGAFVVHR